MRQGSLGSGGCEIWDKPGEQKEQDEQEDPEMSQGRLRWGDSEMSLGKQGE